MAGLKVRGSESEETVEQEPQVDLWAHGYGRAALGRIMRIHRMIEDRDYPIARRWRATSR